MIATTKEGDHGGTLGSPVLNPPRAGVKDGD
jgi:hypothetical protein